MFNRLKHKIILHIKNIPGWRTNKRILVIECDDWGSIRMPSKKTFDILNGKGLHVATSRFNKYDTLESFEDLELLFDVLRSVKDINSRSAVMSPVCNVANPDFEKIMESGFSEYFYEPFPETYQRYYSNSKVLDLWSQGIKEGIFVPELHGRDHIAVQIWMEKLREGNEKLLYAFENSFVALDIPDIPLPAREFRAEYYFKSTDQIPFLKEAIKDSVKLFKSVFAYVPRAFVPGNGIFHPDFDEVVEREGVKFLNVGHSFPYPVEGGKLKKRFFITGQAGPGKLTYYTRNCAFEPTEEHYLGIESTIKQIEASFMWGKPANISTHRVNFVGRINQKSRDKGLVELKKLLKEIKRKWPDIEFMSSGEALNFMASERMKSHT